MAPILDSLRSLSEASAELATKTEELNGVLLRVEKQLAEARVGVSIWLDDGRRLVDETPRQAGRSTGWAVGYAKVGGDWHLAAKRVSVRETSKTGNPQDDYIEFEDAGEPVALVKAPRSVRVEAAALLEKVVTELTAKVRRFVGNIEDAKKLVKSA